MIGGSLGLALRRFGGAREVVGVVREPEEGVLAQELGAVDGWSVSPEILAGCDLVVLATPVEVLVPALKRAVPYLDGSATVTDVGSVKATICREAQALLAPTGQAFVGGHPMAGSERSGVAEADPYLFQHAVYVLCPPRDHPRRDQALARVRHLVEAVGAEPVELDPVEHDRLVAAVSHLPHLVAAALVLLLKHRPSPWLDRLAAGGFRDTTRIASGDPGLWQQILLGNREAVLDQVAFFQGVLDELAGALRAGDAGRLTELLAEAAQRRAQVATNARGLLAPHPEVIVRVPDEVGAIHRVTGILASAGLNLADIEILRVREGEGGSLRLALESEADRDLACRLLHVAGYWARAR